MTEAPAPAADDTPHRLTWEQALAWRMERHRLAGRTGPSDLVRVVGEICGLHAQLMSAAELSLWARIDGLERDAISDALWKHRALVRLWAMRGTLHLLPAAELGVWLSALGTYTHYGNTWAETDVLAEAVGRALAGRILTREELALEVERITGAQTFGERVRFSWGSYLKAVAFRGLLCFAPSEGGRVRFTTPATWVPGGINKPDSVDALREITRRFLAAYAPLTAKDLALWWGGFSPARGARMLAALGEEAVEVDVGHERAWVLARDVRKIAHAKSPNAARLLPAFDPWVVGASREAAALLEPRQKTRVYRRQGWISPALLVNGRMVGVWRHWRKGRRLIVEIEPFGKLPRWARAQAEAEAERLAKFFEGELELKL